MKKVIKFCKKELGITPKIKLKKFKSKHYYGWCEQDEDNRFIIGLNKNLSRKEKIKTICHEMVHVRQFEAGDLIMEEVIVWKNKDYTNHNYWTAPWEVEARKLEKKMYKKYVKAHGK